MKKIIMANINTSIDNNCEVCMDPTTNTGKNKKICCPYCNCISCLVCFKEYLLQTPNLDCMKCKKMLDLDFLSSQTPNNFHNKKYREYKSELEISKEKSLLPNTQEIVERIIYNNNVEKEINKLLVERSKIDKKIIELRQSKKQIKKSEKNKKVFIKKCSVENCRGFLSNDFICGICSTKVCNRCHEIIQNDRKDDEIKDEENEKHVCNEEIVSSIKEIEKNTKSCPECGIRIYKIDGCDQMWCVECKTAFSWNTGIIEKGIIHNPHFYEWQRQNNNGVAPRVPGDGRECYEDVLPDIHNVLGLLKKRTRLRLNRISNAHRIVAHYHERLERQHNANIRYFENQKEILRINYLLKRIDEQYWKKELKRILKSKEKEKCLYDLLYMFRETIRNIFLSFVRNSDNLIEIQLDAIRKYYNQQINIYKRRFKCVLHEISENWEVPYFRTLFQ